MSEHPPLHAPPDLQRASLYGIIDLGYVAPSEIHASASELLDGGVDLIQLRAKNQPLSQVKEWAALLSQICQERSTPFIVNDYPDIAVEVEASGLHLGQEDGSLAWARQRVGPHLLIGRSTHSVQQALLAQQEGFDYIGFGPLFLTPTKKGRPAIGLADIDHVQERLGPQYPVFCIGGITRQRLSQVLAAGAKRVVLVSDLLLAPDRTAATREVKNRLS